MSPPCQASNPPLLLLAAVVAPKFVTGAVAAAGSGGGGGGLRQHDTTAGGGATGTSASGGGSSTWHDASAQGRTPVTSSVASSDEAKCNVPLPVKPLSVQEHTRRGCQHWMTSVTSREHSGHGMGQSASQTQTPRQSDCLSVHSDTAHEHGSGCAQHTQLNQHRNTTPVLHQWSESHVWLPMTVQCVPASFDVIATHFGESVHACAHSSKVVTKDGSSFLKSRRVGSKPSLMHHPRPTNEKPDTTVGSSGGGGGGGGGVGGGESLTQHSKPSFGTTESTVPTKPISKGLAPAMKVGQSRRGNELWAMSSSRQVGNLQPQRHQPKQMPRILQFCCTHHCKPSSSGRLPTRGEVVLRHRHCNGRQSRQETTKCGLRECRLPGRQRPTQRTRLRPAARLPGSNFGACLILRCATFKKATAAAKHARWPGSRSLKLFSSRLCNRSQGRSERASVDDRGVLQSPSPTKELSLFPAHHQAEPQCLRQWPRSQPTAPSCRVALKVNL